MAKEKAAATANLIIRDTVLSGNIKVLTDIRIDGTVDGNISSAAKVVIGVNGCVNGNIDCESALIEGKLKGNISADAVLDIRSSAHIDGNLICSRLIIEDEAFFNGKCKMNSAKHG